MNCRHKEISMRSWTSGAMALVVAMAAALPGAAWAEAKIKSITGLQQGGADVVRIELSEPLKAVPAGFTIQTPPRVAIDLPGVSNATGKSSVDIGQGNIRSVNVASAGERTRLVLNLKQSSTYRAELQGKTLLIVLDVPPNVSATPATADTTHFATSENADTLELKDIEFRRSPDGAGRVVVNLASTQVGVDLKQQGQNLVVEFLRSAVPVRLRRKLDVTDFGTPIQTITTTQQGDRVRMVVEPHGLWEHSAYQTDNQFVLEVRPIKVDPNKPVQGTGYQGEKLTLNFQSIEIRSLLQVIADFSNFNIVTSDTVNGNVTLRLKDVPWDQALDIILQSKGLGVRKNGNVLLVAPKDELSAKETVELEAQKKIADLEPLRTQAFQLNYTKSDDVARALTGSTTGGNGANTTRILSNRGTVMSEPRTNQLFIADIPSKLEEVQSMIQRIDVPSRQVMIEARIVEANDSFGRALGVKLGTNDLRGLQGGVPGYNVGGSQYVALGGNYLNIGTNTLQPGVVTPNQYLDSQMVSLPANAGAISPSASASTLALSLFSATANRFLNLELSALEAEGKGKIVSSPRVITADQTKATVEAGEELPYQVATASGATSIVFRKANVSLEVTPQITPEGNVILSVDVKKDTVGRSTSAGFAIDTKHVQTQALVENGGTVVLGGLFTQTDTNEVNKVPLLGDIPFLGALFRNTTRVSNRTELLIFITPRIVTDRAVVH